MREAFFFGTYLRNQVSWAVILAEAAQTYPIDCYASSDPEIRAFLYTTTCDCVDDGEEEPTKYCRHKSVSIVLVVGVVCW